MKKLNLLALILATTLFCGCGVDFAALYIAYKEGKDVIMEKALTMGMSGMQGGHDSEYGVAVVNKGQMSQINSIIKTMQDNNKRSIELTRQTYGDKAAKEAEIIFNKMIDDVTSASKTASSDMMGFINKTNAINAAASAKYTEMIKKYQTQTTAPGAATGQPQSSYGKAVQKAKDVQNIVNQRKPEEMTTNL